MHERGRILPNGGIYVWGNAGESLTFDSWSLLLLNRTGRSMYRYLGYQEEFLVFQPE